MESENKLQYPLEWTGERIMPEEGRYMFRRHLLAYQFAINFCQDKTVLDIGCGEGYGSCFLSDCAAKVVGIDISEQAVQHAREKYARENLEYLVMSAENLCFEDNSFDVVVSFQVIEHLREPKKFLNEIKRVLKKDGLVFISTTTKKDCSDDIGKYHLKEYHYNEFIDLLNDCFGKVEYYGIHRKGKDSCKVRLLNLLLRLDKIKIRKLFSASLKKQFVVSAEKTMLIDISKEDLKDALDIIGAYKNP